MFISSNRTGFLAEVFTFLDKDAARHAIAVVKGTFDVGEDGVCRAAERQAPFVYADEHYGNPGSTSIRHEGDFTPWKPRADVLVVGEAWAPDGRQAEHVGVQLAGPTIRKAAHVWGDRRWLTSARGLVRSRPEPFQRMPLAFDRAFGGSDLSHPDVSRRGSELRNPVGLGFHVNGDEGTLAGKRLPNIERLGQEMQLWSDKPEPIGFGVVGRGWQPRIRFAGAYDQAWLESSFPFLPQDFDARYFQSAPVDQQVDALRPDDRYECINMSGSGRFAVQVPPHRFSLRFLFDDQTEEAVPQPDTLIMLPHEARVVVLWRASARLGRKPSALREVQVGPPPRRGR